MSIELAFAIATMAAVLLMVAHARWTIPLTDFSREAVEVGPVESAPPHSGSRDILDDYEAQLAVTSLTPEGSAEHRMAILEALLEEADHETSRLELLVDKMGQRLTHVG